MKVLSVIVTTPKYSVSGAVTAAIALSKSLSKKIDIEVAIMSENDSRRKEGNLLISGFICKNPIRRFNPCLPKQLINSLWFTDIPDFIGKKLPDLVHIHNPVPPRHLLTIVNKCIVLNIPCLISSHGFVELFNYVHGYEISFFKRPFVHLLLTKPFKDAIQKCSGICMLSPFESEMLMKAGIKEEKLFLVTNGVDPFFLERADHDFVEKIKKRFNIKPDKINLLFVGNQTLNKGLNILFEAVPYIKNIVRFIIAGKIKNHAEHNKKLKRLEKQLGEQEIVFTDFITLEELRAVYQAADIFTFPSKADTLPLVVLEAMASRLPIISTKVGGIPYQLANKSGILINPEPPELAEAVDRLCDDRELRQQLGQSGFRRVKKVFTWDNAAKQALDAYRKIISLS